MASRERRVRILYSLWETHAKLQEALEAAARARPGEMTAYELETFIEQKVTTDQTEWLVQFFWVLGALGCAGPERMAEWINSHNELVMQEVAKLEEDKQNRMALGRQYKRKLWRLRSMAHFSDEVKKVCKDRLDGSAVVLSLSDIERFMALHMDATLCRDRLDALVRIGLLEDEQRHNLRLFRPTGKLDTIVADVLDTLDKRLVPSDASTR